MTTPRLYAWLCLAVMAFVAQTQAVTTETQKAMWFTSATLPAQYYYVGGHTSFRPRRVVIDCGTTTITVEVRND